MIAAPGEVHLAIEGGDLRALNNERGGHRIQRVPPTERKGRVHTSTVTVAVIEGNEAETLPVLEDRDFTLEWFSGTGAGGQHRNKHQNSCRLTHIATGVVVTAQCRSRQNSYEQARAELHQRICGAIASKMAGDVAADRRRQVGSGERGDKIRTYRSQDNSVKDHRSGRTASFDRVMKGAFDLLWAD